MRDLHTVEGAEAMRVGKEVEGRFFRAFQSTPIQWIAADSDKWLAGHDFIIGGKRVELKSNDGWDSRRGAPYWTVCVEKVTRGGRPIGWSQGKSDIVVFVNRYESRAYLYSASKLCQYADEQRTFRKYDADCFLMAWECPEAGFIKSVPLP